jgi:dipeptidyl aminopeptidase/acylaminoacyl peptidase
MAVSLGYHHFSWWQVTGTLARVALAGGGVRRIQKDVGHADWSPDGRTMALVRYQGVRCLLEYPAGHAIHETADWISLCRVSPDGRRVAFGLHHRLGEGEADVCVIDVEGGMRTVAGDLTNLSGIAWSPSGNEVWFSGIDRDQRHGIWSATLDGTVRDVHLSPTRISLHDVRRDGRALVTMNELRLILSVGGKEGEPEVDLSWFDGSLAGPLSADGSRIVTTEVAEAENPHYACYLRGLDDEAAVRLGEGIAVHLSADGEWVLAITHHSRHALMMHPTGFGETREVPLAGIERAFWAGFHPDGEHVFVVGGTRERERAPYLVPLAGGAPRLLWDQEIEFDRFLGLPISGDGARLLVRDVSGEHRMLHWREARAEPIAELGREDDALTFDDTGAALYVRARSGRDIERLDLASGERSAWRTLAPPDRVGVVFIGTPMVAAGGGRYAYSYLRLISNLYLIEGLETP